MSTPTAASRARISQSRRLLTALLTLTVALGFALFYQNDVASHSAQAPSISFVSAPAVLPRNQPLANYSPLVSIQYSGLEVGTYSLRVHLLETDPEPVGFLCGCTASPQMWCPATFVIDNQNGNNSSGVIVDARITDVHNYQNLLWVADLFKDNVAVTSATHAATSTLNRAPVLNSIGNKSVTVGQSLDFVVPASDPEGDAVTLSAQNLPTGAVFNSATGQFHWQPSTTGTFTSIAFIATQTGATPLNDAELISIEVVNQPAGILSLSAASNRIGEGGPAVLTVNRTNSSVGAVTVTYSTIDGTASSGSDYTGVTNGIVSFASGEVSKSIRVNILNDSTVEANETFQVLLSSPTGATLGVPSQATVTIVDDDNPQLAGQWSSVITWPTVPIHMHVVPDGRVVFWDRHGDHANPTWDVTPHAWNPANSSTFTKLAQPGWDVFCSGHTLTADGRLFVAGGHDMHDFVGAPTAGIYNAQTNTWTAVPNMNAGRWYPTTTSLPNGDLLVIAGTRTAYADINPTPQVFQLSSATWRNLSNALSGPYPDWADLYPFVYVAPNGKLFVAGPQRTARYLDTTGTGAWTDVASSSLCYRDYGSSVMYDNGKVLIVGGNPRDDCDLSIPKPIFPSATAEVIDLNAATPVWRLVSPMAIGRRQLSTTILPDGKVLVTGGSSAPGHDDPAGGVFFAELWDPTTEQWTPMAGHTRYRGYHSNGLLLPDARVLVAGGGHPDPPGGFAENNAEIYSPPYLFKGPRPVITAAPTVVTYGQTFLLQTPDAPSITNVNWIRLPSLTHGFNESQRINRLSSSLMSGGLNVTAPANANLCPPGHYMLFALNNNGVPSVARIIQIVDSTVQFNSASISVGEGAGAALITVSRNGTTSNSVSIDFATSNATAMAGSDYTATTGTLSFNAGETTKTFSVPILDDAIFEGNESVNLTLTSPVGTSPGEISTATMTIVDNETQPSLAISDVEVLEGNSGTKNADFKVTLSSANSQTVSVHFATADGTAQAGSDYQAINGSLTFHPNETSKTISVPVNGDTQPEPNETLLLNLSNGSNAAIADGQGVGSILNDDVPTIQLLLDESVAGAAALDAALFLRDPFLVLNNFSFFNPIFDRNIRIMIFVANFQLAQGEPASSVLVNLVDSSNNMHNINAEDVRLVPGFDLMQITFRLPGNLPGGSCTIRVTAHGQTSNSSTIRIRTQ